MYLSVDPICQERYEGCFRDHGFETLKLLRTAKLAYESQSLAVASKVKP